MNRKYKYLYFLISFLLLACSSSYAVDDACYPDQYPFDGCDDSISLQWDETNSVEEVGANSAGSVSALGGRRLYTWEISGQGFYLDEAGTLKTLITNNSSVTFHTIGACGAGTIMLTDSCGNQIKKEVRSSNGTWASIGNQCVLSGVDNQVTYNGSAPYFYTYAIDGKYKQVVSITKKDTRTIGYRQDTPTPGYEVCDEGCFSGTGQGFIDGICGCLKPNSLPDTCLSIVKADQYETWENTTPGWCSTNPKSYIRETGHSDHWKCEHDVYSMRYTVVWYEATNLQAYEWVCQ